MARISSVVEIPDRRRAQGGGGYSSDRRYERRNRTYSRSRSPVHNRYRRASPDYSYPNLDEPRKSIERNNSDYYYRNKPYLDRDSRNNGRNNVESESDEELKGLSYEEYRRLKRQKLRKKLLRNGIWNCTPSPPRDPNEKSDGEFEEAAVGGDDVKQINELKNGAKSESETDSDSDNYRSKRRSRRKGRKSGSKRKSKRSKSISETESESEDDDSGGGRRRKGRKSRSRRKSRRSKSISETESESEDSGDDDSGEDRRSRKSSRSKSSKTNSKRKRSSKKKSSSRRSESESATEDSDNGDPVKSKKRKHRSSSKSKKKRETSSGSMSADERAPDSEVDAKDVIQKLDEVKVDDVSNIEFLKFKEMIEQQRKKSTLDDEPPVGPMPLPKAEGHISYGGALRPGEGDAIAQFVQQGKRIPRRGEVGLSADEISRFEDLGYVMSGSRHQRMNAIRIRKENQVYSAEDKRALAMFNYEEKAKREQKVMADLQRLVQRHIGEDTGPSHDPFGAGKAVEEADD